MKITEEVKGTVIGSFYCFYEFWDQSEGRLASGYFCSDGEAEAWFKENHPEDYQAGVEMRTW